MKKGHTHTKKIKSLFCSHSLPQYYYEIPPLLCGPHPPYLISQSRDMTPSVPISRPPLPPLFFVLHIQFFSTFDEKRNILYKIIEISVQIKLQVTKDCAKNINQLYQLFSLDIKKIIIFVCSISMQSSNINEYKVKYRSCYRQKLKWFHSFKVHVF